MSLRVLLAVLLAGALVAASLPAIEAAQRTHAEDDLDTTARELETAVERLQTHSDPVPFGVPGARRSVRVDVPERGPNARLRLVPAGANTRLQVAVGESAPSVTVLNATVRPLAGPETVAWNDTLAVRETTELWLRYRQVEGRSVVTVARGFK